MGEVAGSVWRAMSRYAVCDWARSVCSSAHVNLRNSQPCFGPRPLARHLPERVIDIDTERVDAVLNSQACRRKRRRSARRRQQQDHDTRRRAHWEKKSSGVLSLKQVAVKRMASNRTIAWACLAGSAVLTTIGILKFLSAIGKMQEHADLVNSLSELNMLRFYFMQKKKKKKARAVTLLHPQSLANATH
jgi:hypothetical protein